MEKPVTRSAVCSVPGCTEPADVVAASGYCGGHENDVQWFGVAFLGDDSRMFDAWRLGLDAGVSDDALRELVAAAC